MPKIEREPCPKCDSKLTGTVWNGTKGWTDYCGKANCGHKWKPGSDAQSEAESAHKPPARAIAEDKEPK